MLRIFHLYKDYYPIVGGIENHIKMLAEVQAAAGHEVKVLVTNPAKLSRYEEINGVQIVRLPRLATVASTPITFGFLPVLARSVPDITHLHFPYPIGEFSQLIAGHGRKYVITYHSDVVRTSQQKLLRFYRPFLHKVLQKASRILVTSQNYMFSSPYLLPLSSKCEFVPLGIDPHPFQNASPIYRRGNRPVLLFVGRHRYYKGVDDLIRALVDIEAELLLGGDGPMRPEWEHLTGKLNLADRVRFLGDIPDDDLPGLYASADLFILPAKLRAEAFGTVLLEAMAAGLACVTTELNTGTSYVVQDEITGLVVPPSNPAQLAMSINRLLADAPLRRQMGTAGRERVWHEFTVTKMVEHVDAIYQSVFGENQPDKRLKAIS